MASNSQAFKKAGFKRNDHIKDGRFIPVGAPSVKVIECHQSEFSRYMDEIKAEGIVVSSIETEPIRYRYKIHYNEVRSERVLKDEEWRDIPGEFFGFYQISSYGRMRSIRILGEYQATVLTVANKKRITVSTKRLFNEVFGDVKIKQ